MAEVIGTVASGLTLASLLKVCLDAFDLIQASRNQELDYQKLVLKLNIERCRLYTWGQAMHLIPVDGQAQTSPLDSFAFRSLVSSTLEMMQKLFYDADKLENRYGCRPSSQLRLGSIETSSISRALAAAFADFKADGSTTAVQSKYVQKTRWLIHDHKKFKALVSDIKDFVDGLQDVTKELSPKPSQESAIRRRIGLIEDVATLEVVAEVCETDHPSFSETASQKWDIISAFTGSGRDVENWSDTVEPFVDPEIADWENLSITELRHQMVQLLEKHRQLEAKVSATTSEERRNIMRERKVQHSGKHEPTVEAAEVRPSEPATLAIEKEQHVFIPDGDEAYKSIDELGRGSEGLDKVESMQIPGKASVQPELSTIQQRQAQIAGMMASLTHARRQQAQIARMTASLKHEHQQLYGKAADFQDQHTRHENSINAILSFLATVYNRSLQGHEGAPGITNLFSGSIPHDSNQGNVVDVSDYSFDQLNGGDGTMPKPFKRQPLLLQAPPPDARNLVPGTPVANFSNELNSLENSGGNAPLTSSQRADMLRLINNSSNQAGDNAHVSLNPPSALENYDRKLASTKADIEHLAKMQAELDRSVQSLTNLLQPLSPSGSIPGIGDRTSVPPSSLDIDDLLNSS